MTDTPKQGKRRRRRKKASVRIGGTSQSTFAQQESQKPKQDHKDGDENKSDASQ